jgi:hypothetical protein
MSNRGVHSSRADRLSAAVVLQIEDGKIADAAIALKNVLCNIKVKHRNVLSRGMDASHSDQITALTSRKNCERWGVDCSSASGRLGPRAYNYRALDRVHQDRRIASDRVALTHAAGPVLVFFTPPSHRATRLSAPTVISCAAHTWRGARGSPIEKFTPRCLAAFSQSADNSDMEAGMDISVIHAGQIAFARSLVNSVRGEPRPGSPPSRHRRGRRSRHFGLAYLVQKVLRMADDRD